MRISFLFIYFIFYSCTEQVVVENDSNDNLSEKNSFSCDFSGVEASLRTPRNINETVDLINALEKPLQLPCFIQALNRPLRVSSTLSKLSAQPAVGVNSPRVFFFIDDLVLAISVEGKGSHLLELSEMYSDKTSLKGELEFPIKKKMNYQSPYDRILTIGGKSTCSSCHSEEEKDNSVTEENAFTSIALKPVSKMHLGTFRNENYLCELSASTDFRCQMIKSIFGFGELVDDDFPEATPTFLDTL